jgi:hypothetical protein
MASAAKGPEHGCSARLQTKPVGQACTCSTTKCQTDPCVCLPHAEASSRIRLHCPGQAFGEDTARAAFVHTEESACLKLNARWKARPRQIGDRTSVAAVHPRLMLTTAWARGRVSMGAKFYFYRPIFLAIADQVRFCTIRIQRFRAHLQRFTPNAAPSPKVSQNPDNSEIQRHLKSKATTNLRRAFGVALNMETTRASNAKPMTVWCILMICLVASIVAVGVAMFFAPGISHPLVKTTSHATVR